jgi:aconitate hydratase 2/2-methylisocitrate dehydratase
MAFLAVKLSMDLLLKLKNTSNMNTYNDYIQEIEERKKGLVQKPIDGAELLSEIILQKDLDNKDRADSLDFIYNVVPGTTSAAGLKAKFLKEIILGNQ